MSFEWDDAKCAKNLKKHKVDFSDMLPGFDDIDGLLRQDFDHEDQEWREVVIALVGSQLYSICYTMKENASVCRLISARPAEPHEARRYYNG